jgi:hypothetical protein
MNDAPAHHRPDRELLAFGRSDRIGLVLLLLAAGLLAGKTWVVVPLVAWAGGSDLPVPFASEVSVPALDAAGIGHSEAEYLLHVPGATTGQWLLHLLPGVGLTVVVLACAALFAGLVRDVGRNDPFTAVNVRRLRVIGLLLLVAWPVLTLVRFAADAAVLAGLDLGELDSSFRFGLPVGVMAAGLVAGLLAEAFAAGSRLRDDVDGLV